MRAPPLPQHPLPIIAIGASAGDGEALKQVLYHMPADGGAAFIVIEHQPSSYGSAFANLFSNNAPLPVLTAQADTPVQANHIYLIPPGKIMRIQHHQFVLEEALPGRPKRPIDTFFCALAEDQKENAIGVILSGTGHDGTLGANAIADQGGLVLVQSSPSNSDTDIPHTDPKAGLNEYILPPDRISVSLKNYINNWNMTPISREQALSENALETLFQSLQRAQHIDFSCYKSSTIAKRLHRHLALSHHADLSSFVKHLSTHPQELQQLAKGLLYQRTRFLINTDIFHFLQEHIIPQILNRRSESAGITPEEIRIWVPGCATGEEAYSIAMLMDDMISKADVPLPYRIFATDIDKQVLQEAGQGIYDQNATQDLSANYLEKYFTAQGDKLAINPPIRQKVVFACQDIISDPPFSNIDIICCRNVIKDFRNYAQQRALSAFHYALHSAGVLILGHAESTESLQEQFLIIDQPCSVFRKRTNTSSIVSRPYPSPQQHKSRHKLASISKLMRNHHAFNQLSFSESLQEDLLRRWAPNSLILSENLEVLFIYGRVHPYLRTNLQGNISNSIMDMVITPLKSPLKLLLDHARKTSREKRFRHSWTPETIDDTTANPIVDTPSTHPEHTSVTLQAQYIRPEKTFKQTTGNGDSAIESISTHACPGYYIVTITPEPDEAHLADPNSHPENSTTSEQPVIALEARIAFLERALEEKERSLQETVEIIETTNGALQTANEDLIHANEALNSSNEELQSANEELYVVNSECQQKITEITESNDDTDNILGATSTGFVFLDRALLIRKYTQSVTSMINLVPADIGRPFQHISNYLALPDLMDTIELVNKKRVRFHTTTKTENGIDLLIRLHPYTASTPAANHRNGVVIALTNLSELRALESIGTKEHLEPQAVHLNALVDTLSLHLGTVRVLVVDDDASDRRLIIDQLNEITLFDMALTETDTVDKAINQCKQMSFDACLIDYRLGENTALEFVRKLKASGIRLPTIILSNISKKSVDHALLTEDIRDFLNKQELSPLLLQRSIQYAISRPVFKSHIDTINH
jgi:two-component system CheB/CheR fusion protein